MSLKKKKKKLIKSLIKKESCKKPTENSTKKLSELINKEGTYMNRELFQKHFNFDKPSPSAMLRELYRTKKKVKNEELVDLIKNLLISKI